MILKSYSNRNYFKNNNLGDDSRSAGRREESGKTVDRFGERFRTVELRRKCQGQTGIASIFDRRWRDEDQKGILIH